MTASARPDGFDAVVVGAGPNGLVAAVILAEAGQRVLLVEGADRWGGGLRTESLTLPGFLHDPCATVVPMTLASRAFRSLDVSKDGVEFAHPPVGAAHPLDGQPAVLVRRSLDETAEGMGEDGRAWRATIGATARAGSKLVDTLLSPLSIPPRAPFAGARYAALGLLPATVVGRRVFRTEAVRAAFAGMAAHSMLSLREPITAGYGMLLGSLVHSVGWPVVRGGSQVLADALVARVEKAGGEVVTGQPVRSLDDLPPAGAVLLDLTPRQVLAVGGDRLPAAYRRRLSKYRYGPGVFKLDWALSGPMPWTDPAVASAGTVHLGGTLDEIALSEAEVAAGRHPERPFVLVVQATAADPTRAPAGQHTLWAYCHVPNGSTVDMTDAIEAQLTRFAPGWQDLVLARHSRGPAELEAHNANLVGGDIGGGLASIGQFFGRPTYGLAPWKTPVEGLYLCSASTPPGAAVHGMGGWHAARLALKKLAGARGAA